jgi:hypothetical protein
MPSDWGGHFGRQPKESAAKIIALQFVWCRGLVALAKFVRLELSHLVSQGIA